MERAARERLLVLIMTHDGVRVILNLDFFENRAFTNEVGGLRLLSLRLLRPRAKETLLLGLHLAGHADSLEEDLTRLAQAGWSRLLFHLCLWRRLLEWVHVAVVHEFAFLYTPARRSAACISTGREWTGIVLRSLELRHL